MIILVLKTIHIVGFVAWFAGLFYLVRMFVYDIETNEKPEPDASILKKQFGLMEARVYKIICNPAMMLTWTAGLLMIFFHGFEWFKVNTWLHYKLLLLVLLTLYHLSCKKHILKLQKNESKMTSLQFRLFNEVPTLFLIAISIFAVFKNMSNLSTTIVILVFSALLLYIFTKIYKKQRDKNEPQVR